MFFIISKIFWGIMQPLTLILLLMLAGWVLVLLQRRRLGLLAGGLGIVLLFITGFTTLGEVVISPLENRFVRPEVAPAEVDTIVMLGGATSGQVSTRREIAELTEAGDRLAETLRLALDYPRARILLSGGSGLLASDLEPEAETAARFFLGMGIARERLTLEGESRNTEENAELTKTLLGEQLGTVLLVTSAYHMPRSVGLFRKAGIDVVAWPTDYRTDGDAALALDIFNPVENLTTSTAAFKEWIGLAAYFWTGKTDALLPDQASN